MAMHGFGYGYKHGLNISILAALRADNTLLRHSEVAPRCSQKPPRLSGPDTGHLPSQRSLPPPVSGSPPATSSRSALLVWTISAG